jgi:hypothetical protein
MARSINQECFNKDPLLSIFPPHRRGPLGNVAKIHCATCHQGAFPRVDENESKAAAIGYRHDSAKVDKARYPKHETSRQCQNCLAFAPEKPSDEWVECDLMSDRLVHRSGWCSAYKPMKAAKKARAPGGAFAPKRQRARSMELELDVSSAVLSA